MGRQSPKSAPRINGRVQSAEIGHKRTIAFTGHSGFLQRDHMKFLYSKSVCWTITVLVMALFLYGMIQFPSAPIKPCGIEYCGKYGSKVTREVYEAFVIWERALLIVTFLLVSYGWTGWLLKRFRRL